VDSATAPGQWGTPQRLTVLEVFGAEGVYDDPTITNDGELYYAAAAVGEPASIYRAQRQADGSFATPSRVDELSSEGSESTLWVSYDGLSFYLGRNQGEQRLMFSERASTNDSWSAPVALRAGATSTVNSPDTDALGQVSADGLRIYFTSNRDDKYDFDLFMATRPNKAEPFDNVRKLPVTLAGEAEFSPKLSADELTMYYSARGETDGNDTIEMFIAPRDSVDDDFTIGTSFFALNDAQAIDSDFTVDETDRLAFFSSARDDLSEGRERIYMVER